MCAEALAEDARHNLELRRQQQQKQAQEQMLLGDGADGADKYPMLGWVPSNNPFEQQWQVVPLRAASGGDDVDEEADSAVTVDVDMSAPWLSGREPLAIRLAWLAEGDTVILHFH